ncbi:hypothetical protein ACIPUC_31600 [Streptomyces sp. LARHCF249]
MALRRNAPCGRPAKLFSRCQWRPVPCPSRHGLDFSSPTCSRCSRTSSDCAGRTPTGSCPRRSRRAAWQRTTHPWAHTRRFPDLVAAADQLPDGLVLDGELVVWDQQAGQLSFEGLQRRAAARGRSARSLATSLPAFFIAFDILQQDRTELLNYPYRQRRAR